MLTFRSVSFKNFLSTGDVPITIRLDQSPTTLIVGANGAGKSTMLDAICFGLFGKPHRDIKNPQLINSVNGKNCEVQIEFTIGQDKYRVVRGYKPSVFEIWKNGTLLNQESHSRDYQAVLESNILKMNKKSFNQIVVLGAGNFVPFMQMPVWDRRGVIEELLDISVFSDMNTLIKEKLAKSREDLKETENQLAIFKEKVRLQTKHLNDLKQIDANNTQSIRDEIATIESQVSTKQGEANEYQSVLDANTKVVTAAQKAAQKKRQALIGYQTQIQSNLTRIRTESEFYQKNDECPTCQQKIESDIKERRTHQCSTKSAEFNDGLSKLNEALTQANAELDQANARINEMMKVQSSLSTVNATIQSLHNQIAALNKKLKDASATSDTKQAEDELQVSQQEHLRLTQTRSNQIDERSYLDVIQEMLRDTGIKAKVIKQYVPLMNKFINQYLSVLDFFVSFTLDDSFNETIRSRHRDDFSYASFSEGEKIRINLAILFTWRQIAKLKNHNATNLLILDETFDSSLDGEGVENLLRILNTLTATNVFVITHKPDAMADKMAAKLEFAKTGNFSTLKA
jgi:DNA repair exonuclease SbcCD ATPase subunit